MKTFIFTILISLFINTQLMASLCNYECTFKTPEISSEKASKKHDCHQQAPSENSGTSSSDDKNGCNSKLCQLNQVIKAEGLSIDFAPLQIDNNLAFNFTKIEFYAIDLSFKNINQLKNPHYYGQFSNIPLFIQKSSYII